MSKSGFLPIPITFWSGLGTRDSGFQAKSRKSRRDRDSYSNTTEFLPDRGIAALPHFFGKYRALQLA